MKRYDDISLVRFMERQF